MTMPTPRDVFENPEAHWGLITAPRDEDFECQHFDRKEVMRGDGIDITASQINKVRTQVIECISAFGNSNKEGGLLVLGISRTGVITGIQHLTEEQRNSLTHINGFLANGSTSVKYVDCQDKKNEPNKIVLVFAQYVDHAICETFEQPPKAWLRCGPQNSPLSHAQREALSRDKKIVDFERRHCSLYEAADVDRGVLEEFRKVFLVQAGYDYSDEELLYQAGGLLRKDTIYALSNAGGLFFLGNPQRLIPWAYIRLLRFETSYLDSDKRGLPTLEKHFTGPVTTQIRQLRTFFKESGFFKVYQRRNSDGGFTEEPEYPYIAVDEAIVNAVVHRDYAVKLPIECEYYKDAFVVKNPGPVMQREHDVPRRFSLGDTRLDSMPRNPQLTEWLRLMRDERGAEFVRALSEGTRRMQSEMEALSLPSPTYHVTTSQTTVILESNAAEREQTYVGLRSTEATAFANLYRLLVPGREGGGVATMAACKKEVTVTLRDALEAKGWYIDSIHFGRITAHRVGAEVPTRLDVHSVVRLYPAYTFQYRNYLDRDYLCIDYTLELKNVIPLSRLLADLGGENIKNGTCVAKSSRWRRGRIITRDTEKVLVRFFDSDSEEEVPSGLVIPDLPKVLIAQNLKQRGIIFDLDRVIKEHSLAAHAGAARIRAEKVHAVAREVSGRILPIVVAGREVTMNPEPASLWQSGAANLEFVVGVIPEPRVEFHRHQETQDIRDGITKYGAYSGSEKEIEIVPICISKHRDEMARLIERLRTGKFKYKGSERTFSARLTYRTIVTAESPDRIATECNRLLEQNPAWVGDPALARLFLVHTPESGYALDDHTAPYYSIKRTLLEAGIPCQMVDTPTIVNVDWKDLNLALNITAKCGVVPWVLPDAIPDADFFVGLSYTQSIREGAERIMGYANVFNQYGRWEFYSGNMDAFPYEDRTEYFGLLVKRTLERLGLPDAPSVYFHYSAKFSMEDKAAILRAARSVRKNGVYYFVWINTHHTLRLYDGRPETDGSLARGAYVSTAKNQAYLSTTGYNPYRKVLGTPKPLELNIWVERPEGALESKADLRALAVQVLCLTKLNWASTDSLCGEPITIKYAKDIAYLTAAFLRQNGTFKLHPVLEKTPWFI